MSDKSKQHFAARTFMKAFDKLTCDTLEDFKFSLYKVIDKFPDYHVSQKALLLLTILTMSDLYLECIMTEAFSTSLKNNDTNPLLTLFNKKHWQTAEKYELYAAKRRAAFEFFKKNLTECLSKEDFKEINIYSSLPTKDIDTYNSVNHLEVIKTGVQLADGDVEKIYNSLRFYLFITECHSILDYIDSETPHYRLNRLNFYYTAFSWLKKFYKYDKSGNTISLARKVANYVRAFSSDSADKRRQEAFEFVSSISENYFSMDPVLDEITEETIKDAEYELLNANKYNLFEDKQSLTSLVINDLQQAEPLKGTFHHKEGISLELEFSLDEPEEIHAIREALNQEVSKNNEGEMSSKLEFD